MTLELIIDNRERQLISKLQEKCTFNIEQLEIGDILFRRNDETVLIIERKTINDLKASICDGRAREQKARLMGSGISTDRIIYLIEGNLDQSLNDKISGLPVSTILGSLINTQLRDNIKIYKTNSIEESAIFVCRLLDKLTKDIDNYFKTDVQSISASLYATTLKKNKKANLTPEVWFINQLSGIPQVTEKIADVIVKKYSSVRNLISEYETTPEHLKEKLLADLTFELSTGKQRRIGDKISSRIYNFFYNIEIMNTN